MRSQILIKNNLFSAIYSFEFDSNIVIMLGTNVFIWVLMVISKVFADDALVTTSNGPIRGEYYESNITSYYQFLGIPYAKPPVDDLRFEAPQAVDSWNDTLNATTEAPSCVTLRSFINTNESEDCLYLNVFIPSLQSLNSEYLPVVFWIYGGGFFFGSSIKSLYGPDFLVAQNLIVVTFNYRLGPFGFLSTGDDRIPGNNGLKDQNLALKWTKENIHYFGGDPDNITIFGESAGAASVGLHIISDKSAGLFRAGILDSGCALNVWAVQPDPTSLFNEYVALLPNYMLYNDTLGAKGALQQLSVSSLVSAANSLNVTNRVALFVPVVEVSSDDAFLTVSPYESLIAGNFSQVPILMGINTEESLALLISMSNLLYFGEIYDDAPVNLIPTNLIVNDSNLDAAISGIQNMYLKDNGTFLTNYTAIVKYFSDDIIVRSCLEFAKLYSIWAPVYLYEFDYYGNRHFFNFNLTVTDIENVTSHTDELPYLFYSPEYGYSTNDSDLAIQDRMVTMWTNFVKYLEPTPSKLALLNDTYWLPYNSSTTPYYLKINTTIELIEAQLRNDVLTEWEIIFETYGEKPFVTY